MSKQCPQFGDAAIAHTIWLGLDLRDMTGTYFKAYLLIARSVLCLHIWRRSGPAGRPDLSRRRKVTVAENGAQLFLMLRPV